MKGALPRGISRSGTTALNGGAGPHHKRLEKQLKDLENVRDVRVA